MFAPSSHSMSIQRVQPAAQRGRALVKLGLARRFQHYFARDIAFIKGYEARLVIPHKEITQCPVDRHQLKYAEISGFPGVYSLFHALLIV